MRSYGSTKHANFWLGVQYPLRYFIMKCACVAGCELCEKVLEVCTCLYLSSVVCV